MRGTQMPRAAALAPAEGTVGRKGGSEPPTGSPLLWLPAPLAIAPAPAPDAAAASMGFATVHSEDAVTGTPGRAAKGDCTADGAPGSVDEGGCAALGTAGDGNAPCWGVGCGGEGTAKT